MKQFRKVALLLSLCVVALGITQTAHAVPLSSLIGTTEANGLVVGDKVFYNFQFIASNASGGAVAPDATQIFVDPAVGDPIGIVISSGAWVAFGAGQTIDTHFTFDVAIASGSDRISDAHLDLTSYGTNGGGFVGVIETIEDLDVNPGNTLAAMIASSVLPDSDSAIFAYTTTKIRVSKDVFVNTLSGGLAGLSDFEERFTQQVIPEPSSCILLGIGAVVGAVAYRRRTKKTA